MGRVEVMYQFVPEHVTAERKYKQDVISYAGKLLEIVGARTLVVALDNNDCPFVLMSQGRLSDPLDRVFEPEQEGGVEDGGC